MKGRWKGSDLPCRLSIFLFATICLVIRGGFYVKNRGNAFFG